MTHQVTNDKFSTHQGVKERKIDAPNRKEPDASSQPSRPSADVRADSTVLSRAAERLALLATEGRSGENLSCEPARVKLANLQADVAVDPNAVLRAAANLDSKAFEAAIAEPSR